MELMESATAVSALRPSRDRQETKEQELIIPSCYHSWCMAVRYCPLQPGNSGRARVPVNDWEQEHDRTSHA